MDSDGNMELEIGSNIWANFPRYKIYGKLTRYGEIYIQNQLLEKLKS
jgi:hypothetical protein